LETYSNGGPVQALVTFKYPQHVETIAAMGSDQLSVASVFYIDQDGQFQEEPLCEVSDANNVFPVEIANQIWVAARVSGSAPELIALLDANFVAAVDPGPVELASQDDANELILTRPVYDEYLDWVSSDFTKPGGAVGEPVIFALQENYPNPFNPETSVAFDVPTASTVVIQVYNVLGQTVKTITDKWYEPGRHQVSWDGRDEDNCVVASGIYLVKMMAGSFTDSKKMILLR
jgi:hypothetical protein